MDLLNFKIFLLICAVLLLSGCYSYKSVSQDVYINEKEHDAVRLVLKDGREVLIENPKDISAIPEDEKFIIKNNIADSVIYFKDIEKIRERQYDPIKTCFGGAWLTAAGLAVLVSLVAIVLFSIYGPMRIGG